MECFASCALGLETALSDELKRLGIARVRKLKGRVSFEGEAIDAERVCLWSRFASRVYVVLARISCRDADDLYDGTYDVAWEDILKRKATIAVSAHGTNDNLRNTHYSALRVKDALCDRLADEAGARADVDTANPDVRIALTIRGDKGSLQLDLSGDPLFRRLPREATQSDAHLLRPDYAALALAQAGWTAEGIRQSEAEPLLVDVSCGGGGVLLEAASIAAGMAPGLHRKRWGFTSWQAHDETAWQELLSQAYGEQEIPAVHILATDPDDRNVSAARRALKTTGLGRIVTFCPADHDRMLTRLEQMGKTGQDGTGRIGAIIADASDLSLNGAASILSLVSSLHRSAAASNLPIIALTRDELIDRTLGRRPDRSVPIVLDNEEARLAVFSPAGTRTEADRTGKTVKSASTVNQIQPAGKPVATVDVGQGAPIPVLIPESDQFAARLRKVARQRRKWAKREGVTCYRVYDADLPDYSAAIDLYEGSPATPGRWLVVAEYAAPKSVDPDLARARLLDMLAIAPRILEVEPGHVSARSRTRSRGGSQYARKGSGGRDRRGQGLAHPLIQEGGLTFSVNFDDYLDTGIFLDHRVTRDLVRTYAKGCKRFLNLFAYTGTATCYAADGGAEHTTTVDLSNTYLDWAKRNMELNGFTGSAHRFVRADVLSWISKQVRTKNRWDLIFCDPPTFSNSSKMGDRTWDVQRDHVKLLADLAHLLTPGGIAVFSCNLRTFKPDTYWLDQEGVQLEDITAQTIPEDFSRNAKIHHCYIVRRA